MLIFKLPDISAGYGGAAQHGGDDAGGDQPEEGDL